MIFDHFRNVIILRLKNVLLFHLQDLKHVKVLEVIRNADLKFGSHIFRNIKKELSSWLNVMVDLIRASLSYLDGSLFNKNFTAFARSHIECGPVI